MIIRPPLDFDEQFTRAPNAWTRDGRLSLRARGLLMLLLSHRPGWKVSVESLIRDNKEGRDAIRTALNELRACGYLRTQVAQDEDGRFTGQDFVLTDPLKNGGAQPVLLETRPTDNPYYGESAPKEEQVKEDHKREVKSSPPTAMDEAFDAAWKHWPKQVRRKDARTRFMQAAAKIGTNAVAASIVKFGDAYRATTEVKYTPDLATWLHQERWTDMLPTGSAQQRPSGQPSRLDSNMAAVERARARDRLELGS